MTYSSDLRHVLFSEALEYHGLERQLRFIATRCPGDPKLQAALEQMLRDHHDDQEFHASATDRISGIGDSPTSTPEVDVDEIDQQIDGYRIRERLGEGGMGVVYVAEQFKPVRRKVALKIIRPGTTSRDVLRRFEAERQALAIMNHDHIARVFDGGATESGQPYFVMELVQGPPITEYCDTHRLDPRERLKLFLKVCEAVRHAHRKGIIHRDLKPSNLLVPEIDGKPVPKVIDFGVAKALGQKLSEQTVYTHFAQLVGTPLYMSPEQAGLGVVDVDTRSDVYSLGVVLYELLTGCTPFDRDTLKNVGYDEMRRIIREDDPRRPSLKISALKHQTRTTFAGLRGTDARHLTETLRQELDWIVMKALEKDRSRRYESVTALVQDVQRYLDGQSVEACPPSIRYLTSKYVRRHQGLITSAAIIIVTAIIGMAASLWYARASRIAANQARYAEVTAEREAAASERAKREFQRLLYIADMKMVADAVANQDVPRASALLTRHATDDFERSLRGFEWYYYRKAISRAPLAEIEIGNPVQDVVVSPDKQSLAVTSAEGTITLYDTTTWTVRFQLTTETQGVNALTWSDDSQWLAAACVDGTVSVWDMKSQSRIWRVIGHEGDANGVRISPDKRFVYSCGDDRLAKKWELATGQPIHQYRNHTREVEQIDLSPQGEYLATAGSDSRLRIWDTATGEEVNAIRTNGRVVCTKFTSNGRLLAAGTVRGELLLVDRLSGEHMALPRDPDGAQSLQFVPSGEYLVVVDRGGAIQLHKMPEESESLSDFRPTPCPIRWMIHEGRATTIDVSPDGRLGVTAGRDGFVRVWDLDVDMTRWEAFRAPNLCNATFQANNRLLVAGDQISVLDVDRRLLVASIAPADPGWKFVQSTPDGSKFVAARQGEVVLFDGESKRPIQQWQVDDLVFPMHVAVSADGRRVAVAQYDRSESVLLCDAQNPRDIRRVKSTKSYCVAFSHNGKWLACGELDDAKLIDLQSDAEPLLIRGHTSSLSSLVFSPDDRWLATVGHDRGLRLWKMPESVQMFSLAAHRDYVRCVTFSPDGNTIATSGDDCVVRLWHVATGQPLGSLPPERDGIRRLQFSQDGMRLVATLDNGYIVVYDAAPGDSESATANRSETRL